MLLIILRANGFCNSVIEVRNLHVPGLYTGGSTIIALKLTNRMTKGRQISELQAEADREFISGNLFYLSIYQALRTIH